MALQKVNIKALVQKIADKAKEVAPANKQARIAAWNSEIPAEKVEDLEDKLVSMQQQFRSVVPKEARLLTTEELVSLGQELLSAITISEAMESVRQRVKTATFNHLNVENADKRTPEAVNDEILIPELGYKFIRQAAGFTDATYDKSKLKDILTSEQAAAVLKVTTKVVETVEVDEDALVSFVLADPALEAKMAEIITPGTLRAGSFYFKPIGGKK